jgi:hypothetical protein
MSAYSNSYEHIACIVVLDTYIYYKNSIIFYITKLQPMHIIQNLQSIYYTLLYLKLVGPFIEIKSWMKIKEKS